MVKNMTEGSPLKVILNFSLPILLGYLVQILYALADAMIVGRFLGVNSFAAVGCTGSLIILAGGFVNGMMNGITVKLGHHFGAGNEAGVRRSAAICFLTALAVSLLLMVSGFLFGRPVLLWLQTPAAVLPEALAYLYTVSGGVVVTTLFYLLLAVLRALGDSRTPMLMMVFSLLLNIAFDPVALLVLECGVPGVGLATILAQLIGALLCLCFIRRKMERLFPGREDWRRCRQEVWEHWRIGVPMGLQTAMVGLGAMILQLAFNRLGEAPVAAYAAAQKIDMLASLPLMALATAMTAYTAQNFGARRFDRIRSGIRQSAMLAGGFAVFASLFVCSFGAELTGLLVGTAEKEITALGQRYLLLTGSFYVVLAFLYLFRYTLQGLGRPLLPMAGAVTELVGRILAVVFLAGRFGYTGACLAAPLAWLMSLLVMGGLLWYFMRQTEREIAALRQRLKEKAAQK